MGATLCDESDVSARLGRDLTDAETDAWPGLAEEATGLVEGFIRFAWPDDFDIHAAAGTPLPSGDTPPPPVPKTIRVVTSRMTARALTAPKPGPGVPIDGQQSSSSTFGPMSYARGFSADSVFSSPWLSKSDRMALLRFRQGNIAHVPMYNTGRAGRHSTLGYDFLDPRRGWGPW